MSRMKRAVATVLTQINRAADSDDERDDHRADDQQRRSDDARPDAAGGVSDAGRLHLVRDAPLSRREIRGRSTSFFFLR